MTEVKVKDIVRPVGDKHGTWTVRGVGEGRVAIQQNLEFGRNGLIRDVGLSDVVKLCPKLVSDGGRSVGAHYCGRQIKDEERGLCGLHAAANRRHREKVDAMKERRERNGKLVNADKDRIIALGIDAQVETFLDRDFVHIHTGRISMTLAELERALEAARGAQQ